ncbi:hypothetical protein ACFE04_006494 [Oxalis oulophora]
MANSVAKMNLLLGLVCLTVLIQKGSAREFSVGPSQKWGVPNSENDYNKWAESNRFQIKDSIVFVYPSGNDSVLEVTKENYNNCTSESPIAKFKDGHTVFTFNRSGAFYFISGTKENCLKGEKLIVVVLGDRSGKTTANTTTASPPSPGTAEMTPSPAPIGPESPPSGTVEITPAPGPVSDQSPPKNSASTVFMTTISSIGALVGSSLILTF